MTSTAVDSPILLAVAPNGARKSKQDHPQLPITKQEIANTARECLAAGASMIHLHVRDADLKHSLSVDIYREVISAVREITDNRLFIQVTSESAGLYSPVEQFAMIHELQPDAVSIGLREIQTLDKTEINQHFCKMRDHNTYPQIILYNHTDLAMYKHWLSQDVLPGESYPLLLVIGKQTIDDCFDNAIFTNSFIDDLAASSWMVCTFAENEYRAAKLAARRGGHIRVGFENNLQLKDGSIAKNNAALISQMATYIENHLKNKNRQLATYAETKNIMRPNW